MTIMGLSDSKNVAGGTDMAKQIKRNKWWWQVIVLSSAALLWTGVASAQVRTGSSGVGSSGLGGSSGMGAGLGGGMGSGMGSGISGLGSSGTGLGTSSLGSSSGSIGTSSSRGSTSQGVSSTNPFQSYYAEPLSFGLPSSNGSLPTLGSTSTGISSSTVTFGQPLYNLTTTTGGTTGIGSTGIGQVFGYKPWQRQYGHGQDHGDEQHVVVKRTVVRTASGVVQESSLCYRSRLLSTGSPIYRGSDQRAARSAKHIGTIFVIAIQEHHPGRQRRFGSGAARPGCRRSQENHGRGTPALDAGRV